MTIKDIKLDKIGMWLLLAFVAVCPIFYDTANVRGVGTLRLGQEQMYQLGATILFTIVFLENIYLAIFFLWCITLYFYFNFPPIAGNYVVNIFWGLLIYQIVYKLVDFKNVRKVFNVIACLAALNMLWIGLQFLNVDLIFLDKAGAVKTYSHDFTGLMGLKAHMGIFFALAVPIVCYYRIWLAIPLFIPIYLSDCSVAMVGGISALLFAIWFQSRKLCIILTLLLGILGSIYIARDIKLSGEMFTNRLSLWKVSLRDAFKHPITGWGLDSFRNMGTFKPFMYFANARTGESGTVSAQALKMHNETGKLPPMDFIKDGDSINPWDHPHNEYISLLYETGMVGVVIIGFLLVNIIHRFYPNDFIIPLAGYFIVILVVSIGQFPFHVARNGAHIPIFLAIYYKLTDLSKEMELSHD